MNQEPRNQEDKEDNQGQEAKALEKQSRWKTGKGTREQGIRNHEPEK